MKFENVNIKYEDKGLVELPEGEERYVAWAVDTETGAKSVLDIVQIKSQSQEWIKDWASKFQNDYYPTEVSVYS